MSKYNFNMPKGMNTLSFMFTYGAKIFEKLEALSPYVETSDNETDDDDTLIYEYTLRKDADFDKGRDAILDFWNYFISLFYRLPKFVLKINGADGRHDVWEWNDEKKEIILTNSGASDNSIEAVQDILEDRTHLAKCDITDKVWNLTYDLRGGENSDVEQLMSTWTTRMKNHPIDGDLNLTIMAPYDTVNYKWDAKASDFVFVSCDSDSAFGNEPGETVQAVRINVDPKRSHAVRTMENLSYKNVIANVLDNVLPNVDTRICDMSHITINADDPETVVSYTIRRQISRYEYDCFVRHGAEASEYLKSHYGYRDFDMQMIVKEPSSHEELTSVHDVDFTFFF